MEPFRGFARPCTLAVPLHSSGRLNSTGAREFSPLPGRFPPMVLLGTVFDAGHCALSGATRNASTQLTQRNATRMENANATHTTDRDTSGTTDKVRNATKLQTRQTQLIETQLLQATRPGCDLAPQRRVPTSGDTPHGAGLDPDQTGLDHTASSQTPAIRDTLEHRGQNGTRHRICGSRGRGTQRYRMQQELGRRYAPRLKHRQVGPGPRHRAIRRSLRTDSTN